MGNINGRFIFISGGVVSGVGKGVTTASLALLIKSRGFTVSTIKCDMYVNIDAGTMNPTEHGEVFVTEDGMETDQDIGTYIRFLRQPFTCDNYTTTGQIYNTVLQKERRLEYGGRCVGVVPDIPEEIIRRILAASKNAEFTFVELGGTVGEYQTVLFLEATRILAKRLPNQTLHIHVSHFPFLKNLGEIKSKPTQLSIRRLNECGITPDFVVARSEKIVDEPRFNTLCQNSNLTLDQIIFGPDDTNIYNIPMTFEKQKFAEKVLKRFGMNIIPRPHLEKWSERLNKFNKKKESKVFIGIAEKYRNIGEFTLSDTHISVLEAVKHASIDVEILYEIMWINVDNIKKNELAKTFKNLDGLIVPQGWGSRGAEGKILCIKYARENKVPFLGLCYGMQMAVVEFGRHIGIDGANSIEIDTNTPNHVIHIMPDQIEKIKKSEYGGTIRKGNYPCKILKDSMLYRIYGQNEVFERHRHRYEFNNDFRDKYTTNGLVFSGLSPDDKLVEAFELPDHPFFIGTQYHPEFQSYFEKAHPLFISFIKAAKEFRNEKG